MYQASKINLYNSDAGHSLLFVASMATISQELSGIKNSCSSSSLKWIGMSPRPYSCQAWTGAGRVRTPQVVRLEAEEKLWLPIHWNRTFCYKASLLQGSLPEGLPFSAVDRSGSEKAVWTERLNITHIAGRTYCTSRREAVTAGIFLQSDHKHDGIQGV